MVPSALARCRPPSAVCCLPAAALRSIAQPRSHVWLASTLAICRQAGRKRCRKWGAPSRHMPMRQRRHAVGGAVRAVGTHGRARGRLQVLQVLQVGDAPGVGLLGRPRQELDDGTAGSPTCEWVVHWLGGCGEEQGCCFGLASSAARLGLHCTHQCSSSSAAAPVQQEPPLPALPCRPWLAGAVPCCHGSHSSAPGGPAPWRKPRRKEKQGGSQEEGNERLARLPGSLHGTSAGLVRPSAACAQSRLAAAAAQGARRELCWGRGWWVQWSGRGNGCVRRRPSACNWTSLAGKPASSECVPEPTFPLRA